MTNMTRLLINIVLFSLAYLLIGKIEDIGYRKGYQDGAASKPPRIKNRVQNQNQSQDDDKSAIH